MKLSKLRQYPRVLVTVLAVGLAGAGGAAYGEGMSVGASTTKTGPDAMTGSSSTTVTNTPIESKTTTITNTPSGATTTTSANTTTTAAGTAAGTGATTGTSSTMSSGSMAGAQPMLPAKSEPADSAFTKLDASGKGFIARDDIKGLAGFDTLFDKYNAKHDGRLTREEFAQAWAIYKTS